jgi:hypothetical protein
VSIPPVRFSWIPSIAPTDSVLRRGFEKLGHRLSGNRLNLRGFDPRRNIRHFHRDNSQSRSPLASTHTSEPLCVLYSNDCRMLECTCLFLAWLQSWCPEPVSWIYSHIILTRSLFVLIFWVSNAILNCLLQDELVTECIWLATDMQAPRRSTFVRVLHFF